MIAQNPRRFLVPLAVALALSAASAGSAAANQFTLDHSADSIGPVVADQSGTAYVAWLHSTGSGDVDMFCKLAPRAKQCAHPLLLPVTLPSSASTSTPFPVLGPGNDVFVVAPSYDSDQFVMWESTNGGTSFGSPYVGPPNNVLADGLDYTDVCGVAASVDDVIPFDLGGQYDRSQGVSALGSVGAMGIEYEVSSNGPFASWSFDIYGNSCYVSSSINVTQGQIPDQWFTFGGSSPVSGVPADQTALGWANGGTPPCPHSVELGDEVEAYDTGSSRIRFFRWSSPTGPCSEGGNTSPSGEANWAGPTTVTNDGDYPRLAGGRSGLFLLTGDGGSGTPRAVDIRRYDLANHTFGGPIRLSRVRNPSGLDPDSGGLGENYTTGELAVVWPDLTGNTHQLSLFISTDGGSRFSSPQDIAHIDSAYAGGDDARVAVAPNGNGWVTWLDGGGLHIADFQPRGTEYDRLVVRPGSKLELPVTCEAPTSLCEASAKLTLDGTSIGSGHRRIRSGQTKILVVTLNAAGISLLSAHHRFYATLKLNISHPAGKATHLSVGTLIVR